MSRPTPRTDSAIMEIPSKFGSICVVRVELALDLEHDLGDALRERDEAREALAATKHYLTKERDDALSQIVQAECRSERFCQERDEARGVASGLAKQAERLCKERDEARADRGIARLSAQNADRAHDRLTEELTQALKERDEARNKMADAIQEVDLRTLDYLRLREAIIVTLEENRHLADGDDCTLAKLKSVVPEWK